MKFLDEDRLRRLDSEAFRTTPPYPWINPAGLLTEEGFACLHETLPEPSIFQEYFGVARSHGQAPHDRLTLEYRTDLPVAEPWHAFTAELRASTYQNFVRRMFGRGRLKLSYHWHYTPNGCSVSPHCDAKRKLGSHIFYFNTADDWSSDWGGETLILDDGGEIPRKSAPDFEDFDAAYASDALGNRSLLFARRESSWHGVKPIRCPEGRYRKVFIVVIEDLWLSAKRDWMGRLTGNKRPGY